MQLFSCFSYRPSTATTLAAGAQAPGRKAKDARPASRPRISPDTYLRTFNKSIQQNRALKLLDKYAKQDPKTSQNRAEASSLRQKLADSVPGYTLAFRYREKLDFAALLAQALTAGFRHRFAEQPLSDRSPMQMLIREAGCDEIERLEGDLTQIWQDQVVDEKAAVRLASAATPALLEALATPTGEKRLAFERLVERWAARHSTHEQPPSAAEGINRSEDAEWAELEKLVAAGRPHPTEQILMRFCKTHAPGAASTDEMAIERRILLAWLAPVDLVAMTTWMGGDLGREYAKLTAKLHPHFTRDLDRVMPLLIELVRLAMWSLKTTNTGSN